MVVTKTEMIFEPDYLNRFSYENDVGKEDLITEASGREIVQTLPDSFNSMLNQSIEIDSDHPQHIIENLGRKLGINDYRTNMATFWLLDTMAIEVIRWRDKISPSNLAILISWLAGELKLIQEQRLTRSAFLQRMSNLFTRTWDQLGKGWPLPYWEELSVKNSPQLNKELKSKEVVHEEDVSVSAIEFRLNMTKHEEDRPIDATSEEMQRIDGHLSTQSEKSVVPEVAVDILEAIIESTYAMYANAFHYANVSAAFVQPIEVHLQQLPYTLKPPRPVRLPTLFPVITDTPEKGTAAKNRSKIDKEKPAKNKEREKSVEIQPSLPVLTDEEIIDQKRSRILPLMESNEAPHMLQQFSLSSMSTSAITEISVKKKGKKKAS